MLRATETGRKMFQNSFHLLGAGVMRNRAGFVEQVLLGIVHGQTEGP